MGENCRQVLLQGQLRWIKQATQAYNEAPTRKGKSSISQKSQGKGLPNNMYGQSRPLLVSNSTTRKHRLIISFQMGNGCEVMVYQCPAKIVPCCVLHTKPSKISQNENRTPLEGKHLSPLHKNHQG
jgi:hypothetical protein